MKKVSIILIPFNNNRTFFRTLKQVLQVRYDDYEILIIDNNLDKKVENAINPYLEKYKKIHYFRNNNRFILAGAMNMAIDKADSHWIVYLCTNHVWIYSNDWLAHMTLHMSDIYYKARFMMGGHVQKFRAKDHVQGGVFIAFTEFMKKFKYEAKANPFQFMDVNISARILRGKYRLKKIPRVMSVMNQGWTSKNHRDNIIVKKYKIVHCHGLEQY